MSQENKEASPYQVVSSGTVTMSLSNSDKERENYALNLQHTPGADSVLWLDQRKMLSWGPRHEHFDRNVAYPKEGEATHFWSVFTHGPENEVEIVTDLEDEAACGTLLRALVPAWLFTQYLGEGQTADLDPFPFGESIATARRIANIADSLLSSYWQGKALSMRKNKLEDNLPF